MTTLPIHDSVGKYAEEVGEGFALFTQEIPQDFLDDIKSERMASATIRAGSNHRVASVPVACYDLWIRQGLDPYNWRAKELLLKLTADGLDGFITTNKVI